MATTITSSCGGLGEEFDRDAYTLLAQAVNAVNRVAKHFKSRPIRNGAYEAKHSLLSLLLESDMPGIEVSWQKQANGASQLLISISNKATVHCLFEWLSPAARCKIVGRIGPGRSAAA